MLFRTTFLRDPAFAGGTPFSLHHPSCPSDTGLGRGLPLYSTVHTLIRGVIIVLFQPLNFFHEPETEYSHLILSC